MQALILSAESFHYVVRVLRCSDGERLKVFNGDGNDYTATLRLDSKKSASIRIESARRNDNESPLYTILIQALSKGERMDFVMQKAVELGVNEIIPVRSDFCAVKLDDHRAQKKRQHWRAVMVSACEQSGRAVLPKLHELVPLNHILPTIEAETKWVLHPYEQQVENKYDDKPLRAAVLIGPEGGLSDEEVNMAVQQGFVPTRLGQRILRTETAAIAALSVCQQLWGDWCV